MAKAKAGELDEKYNISGTAKAAAKDGRPTVVFLVARKCWKPPAASMSSTV